MRVRGKCPGAAGSQRFHKGVCVCGKCKVNKKGNEAVMACLTQLVCRENLLEKQSDENRQTIFSLRFI